MMTEKQKMINGDLYNASDAELIIERKRARLLLKQLNNLNDDELKQQVLKELIPDQGLDFWVEPPFFCDYGTNIIVGDKVFFNFNCTILDVMKVTIGNNVLFGPAIQVYTATHPMDYKERSSGLEFAKPVTIGSDVWIGGGVIICPGVTIGDRCVIGAGSVVTKNIAADTFAAGNPCRPIKSL
ncbi:sugar O-acetyltransferase [Mucilaginibacter sp. HMF7410]|uniref:Acetyltransferase n=2 Tax=Mucilaginibacter arboris TaxID=2682090 RepID=A0A7K1T1I3_9SPHI|nr:sugar O-acetyltransferase [Mucilaginibacter arboris]